MVGIARSLAEAGYSVVVGGGSEAPATEQNLNEGEPKGRVRYIGVGESPAAEVSPFHKLWRIFNWGKKTVKWLDCQPHKPSHVVVYGGSAQYILRLLPWCKRHGIPLIVDVVEWYDPKQMKGGRFGPFYLSAQFALRYLYPRCDGVIAISSLLEKHYMEKGCKVVRVPPSLDVQTRLGPPEQRKPGAPLLLVYAGIPGKKDLLLHVINAVEAVDPSGKRLRLRILGSSAQQLGECYGRLNFAPCIEIFGHVNQVEVVRHIRAADFTVLLRIPALFANAGFPTKFVESLASGTPVICNLTSDLGSYMRDGMDGLICQNFSVQALVDTLERALSLSDFQLQEMRGFAVERARNSFDFRVHAEDLGCFVENTK